MKLHAVAVLSTLALVQAEKLNARHVHLKRDAVAAAAAATTTSLPPLDTSTTIPPLASISSGMPSKAAPTVTTSYTAGATPPISGAPVLPTSLQITKPDWPTPDHLPDTSSPEVQAWMKELDGWTIPNIPPTKDGTCVGDPVAAAAAADHGWWTCGGHTRDTDIVNCPTKLDWGLSFDDGPAIYTPTLLKKLKEKNLLATFFVVGSRVIDRPQTLLDEYMTGHEISVHTWSHPSLTTLTNEQIVAELGWTRKIIHAVLGVTPTTMRPPKGDIDDHVRAISLAMGLVPVIWTATPNGGKFDTFDWNVAAGNAKGSDSFEVFKGILGNATTIDTGFISLQHDLFEIEVDLSVGYTIDAALSHTPKFNLQPIGKCNKFIDGAMYRETTTNTSFPLRNLTAGGLDVDGDGTVDIPYKSAAGSLRLPFWSSIALASVAVGRLLL